MNTQELINKIEQLPSNLIDKKVVISKDSVVELVKQLDERPKVKVSQVAVDYYSQYKDKLSGFDEWFCDLYDDDFESNFAELKI
ncbi:hypothetical protein MU448_11840 [Streptococcus sp. O1]|uniref:hypothetical protein n=1 Tax=Streptococcus sp. O1 TaxID=2928735 RepID=UPI00211B673D|nr:hypothetical protein [Streptococcus sp. O1]MCQ9215034.1 hypothetical protein [Streptococcus sp. O1]